MRFKGASLLVVRGPILLRLALCLDSFGQVAQLCTVAARVGALSADVHARELVALNGAGFAGGNARGGMGVIALVQAARMLIADGGAVVAQLHAQVHSALGRAFLNALAADLGARCTGVDAIGNFFGHCHWGLLVSHPFARV